MSEGCDEKWRGEQLSGSDPKAFDKNQQMIINRQEEEQVDDEKNLEGEQNQSVASTR